MLDDLDTGGHIHLIGYYISLLSDWGSRYLKLNFLPF